MDELWKDIPNYEGLYQASNFGRIRSCENKTTKNSLYERRIWKMRILSGRGREKSGYRVGLWKDGKCKDFLVARLVATTFLEGYIHTDMTVNHKNGNRFDNRVENLEWLTRGDNIRHAFITGLQDANLKKCELSNGFTTYKFNSLASASKFLGRNHGYISNCISKNRKIVSKTGIEFELKLK